MHYYRYILNPFMRSVHICGHHLYNVQSDSKNSCMKGLKLKKLCSRHSIHSIYSPHSIHCIYSIYSIHFTSTCRNLWWLHSTTWSEHLVFIIADFPGVIPYSISSTSFRDCRAIGALIVLAAVTWVQLEPVWPRRTGYNLYSRDDVSL